MHVSHLKCTVQLIMICVSAASYLAKGAIEHYSVFSDIHKAGVSVDGNVVEKLMNVYCSEITLNLILHNDY